MSEVVVMATSEDPLVPDKVFIQQWPGEHSVIGPPSMIKDLEEVADGLAESGFMKVWISGQIRKALAEGHIFQNIGRVDQNWRGRDDGVKSQYQIARRSEVIAVAENQKFTTMSGHAISRRAQEKAYVLHYLDSDTTRELYESLPKQAKMLLDILSESGREEFSEAAVIVLMSEQLERFKTKQDVTSILGFYRRRLINEGHLEEVGEDNDE